MPNVNKIAYTEELLELYFEKGSIGLSFALMDVPVEWNDTVDKDKALDLIFYNERVVKANQAYLSLFNIKNAEDLISRTPSDFFADKKLGKTIWRGLLENGQQKFNAIELSPGVWVEGINQCLYNEQGQFIGHVATIWDVSDKKEELKLVNQERMLKKISDFHCYMDEKGHISFPFTSGEFTDIFGLTGEIVKDDARALEEIIFFADKERFNASVKNSAQSMSYLEMEFRIEHPEKGQRWIKSIARPEKTQGGVLWQGYFSDITDEKRSEEWILFLNSALMNISDSVIITAGFGSIVFANRSATELHGYTQEELIGRDSEIFLVQPMPEKEQELMFKTVAEGRTYVSEAQSRRKDGSVFDCEFSLTAIFGEDGVIKAYIGVQRDITDKKKMIRELEKSNARFEQLTKQSRAIAWEIDESGLIKYISNGAYNVLGYEPADVIGHEYLYNFLFNGKGDKVLSKMRDNTAFTNITSPFISKSGEIMHMVISGMPMIDEEDNSARGYHGLSIDITEKVGMAQAINNEKERYKTTLLSVGDGVISTDRLGYVTVMNPVAEKLTGWTQEEAEANSIDEVFKIIDEVTGKPQRNPAREALESTGSKKSSAPILLVSKNGDETPIEINAAPIINDSGEATGAVIVFRDVTEARARQKQIEYLSYRDPLTGLYNRRYMQEAILKLDISVNLPLTVMTLDVNGLKLTNDAFGHWKGDALLETVADILIGACRSDDVIARMGGDEFLILLPKTNESDAEQIKERIIKASSEAKLDSIMVSVAIGYCTKTKMHQDIDKILINADNRMYKEKLKVEKTMRNNTIETVLRDINFKYDSEQVHTERVSQYCQAIAEALNMSPEEKHDIKVAGSLHDIGKITVPSEILNKPGKLTEEEYEIVKRHPETGYQILKCFDEYASLAKYMLYHHERWDGTGYPAGLKGSEIPLQSRIIAVADSYEAMTSNRPYQKMKSAEDAQKELKEKAGSQFDPDIVKTFLELI